MSKISLSPDASGTGIFTIASPNSNTNRTLTLPDDTGTIVTNSGNQAGSFTTLNTSGAVVFNDAGADVDFRVEGDTEANLLFVDAGNDRVGIGTDSPVSALNVIASVDKVAVIGAASNLDSDADVLWGAGIKETQLLNGTSSRPGVLSIGGSLTANESMGIINFFRSGNTDGYRSRAYIRGSTTGSGTANQHGGILQFGTAADDAGNPTERARITSGGAMSLISTTDGLHVGSTEGTGTSTWLFRGASASTAGTAFSGTDRFFVFTNGNVTNSNGSYGTISDLKLKQDILDASSQWSDIKALRFCKYRLKSDVELDSSTKHLLGLIAQEVEAVSPGLIDEHPDTKLETKTREVEKTREVTPAVLDEEGNVVEPAVTETYTETEEYTETVDLGTTTKSIKTSILYMKAVKALQEAMERIETLEAKVAALENA